MAKGIAVASQVPVWGGHRIVAGYFCIGHQLVYGGFHSGG